MPKLSDFKALLFDIDNTLVNPNKEFSPLVKNMIQELADKGFVAGACTGRAYPSLKNYILPIFPQNALHVICGGGQVIHSNGDILWEKSIPADVAHHIGEQFLAIGAEFFVVKHDALYGTLRCQTNLAVHPWNIPVKKVDDLTDWTTPLICVTQLNEQIRAIVKENEKHLTYKEMPWQTYQYYDLTAENVNKGVALQEWSSISGIPLEEVIGFGDSVNDLEFLSSVGFSVAMGNSHEEVKAMANKVIGHINDDGLGVYLESILKGNDL